VSELGVMDTWVYGLLSGDTTLTAMLGKHPDSNECIYDALAPSGAVLPYVVFQVQTTSPDTVVVGNIRIAANVAYAVRAIGGVGFATVRPIAAQIDALLHGARGVSANGVILACYRERPLKLPPEIGPGGVVYYHQGGIYRVRARVTGIIENGGDNGGDEEPPENGDE